MKSVAITFSLICILPALSRADDPIDFDRIVAPLLASRCLECHNASDRKGKLDLSSAREVFRQKEPVVIPGKLEESTLWQKVHDGEMPPKKPLSDAEKSTLKKWIESGAKWGKTDPIDRYALSTDTHAGADWWSLRPVKRPALPAINTPTWSENPIDAFVLAKLDAQGLTPATAASRRQLIRRAYFDLIGLPPTPQEIDTFEKDSDPRAYEKLLDRLLASPHYGERWARHWLDIARYTESQGFEYDRIRPNAWHYRDYVIAAFNNDKPYNLFVAEQLAGDVMNFAHPREPATPEGLIATSLLVCGPWDQAGNSQANATQRMITREEELEDLVSVVGQSFLGLTINCARCHAHKYDPISHADYYRFKSIFEGVKHGERPIAPAGEVEAHRKQLTKLQQSLKQAEKELHEAKQQAMKQTLAKFDWNGLVVLTDTQRKEQQVFQERVADLRKQIKELPPLPESYAGIRQQPAPTRRLVRGDVTSPAETLSPAGLSIIKTPDSQFHLQPDAPEGLRRLMLARWLTDPRHPLTARVLVNRLWHHHFGRGIVDTPSDFGFNGARPTHPELLDWLAAEFVEGQPAWSIKRMHKLIMMSATYQQASQFNAKAAALDSDNTLLWRYTPRRLEGEIIRDAMLTVTGQLNRQMGGPSFRPFIVSNFNSDFYESKDMIGPEFNRRSIYRIHVNSGKSAMMDALDCPDPSIKTPSRRVTTTPLAALALMNNSFIQRQSKHLAERVTREASNNTGQAIELAYELTLGRPMTEQEKPEAMKLVKEHGLPALCWALLNATEFLYVK